MLWRRSPIPIRWLSPKFLVLSTFLVALFFCLKYAHNRDNSTHNHIADRLSPRHFAEHAAAHPEDDQPQLPIAEASRYEALIVAALAKQLPGLGDNGEAVVLAGPAKDRGDKQLTVIALNEELSQQLSYNRTLADVRSPLCRNLEYDLDTMPTASIVIIFYNEPYSVLLRTVYSALTTGDPRILKEVILVDDCSSHEELKDQLDYFVRTRLPSNVRIVRLKSR